jgi:hypothetical protein
MIRERSFKFGFSIVEFAMVFCTGFVFGSLFIIAVQGKLGGFYWK